MVFFLNKLIEFGKFIAENYSKVDNIIIQLVLLFLVRPKVITFSEWYILYVNE
jgi:hypothetical protein